MQLHLAEFNSPIGVMRIAAGEQFVHALDFSDFEERMLRLLSGRFGAPEFQKDSDPLNVRARLAAYFDGDLLALDSLPVDPGGTEFQQLVWRALREIAPGRTESYGRLAARIGRPQAARAVGHANSLNPIAIAIPCHRVIGASSALTGYAAGIDRKRWLLNHETTRGKLSACGGLF